MQLPVSSEYLSYALESTSVGDLKLTCEHIADINLNSGQLVACDPFVMPDSAPFKLSLPSGCFPVLLSIAHISDDQRVAYATLRFTQNTPIEWRMLTVRDQDTATLGPGELFGYPVDAGTGCFMDQSAALQLAATMRAQPDFFEKLIAEMDKTYRHTWSWLDLKFGDANLVAFSSGYGDGLYGSYAGIDSAGQVCAVVTDFCVVPTAPLNSEGTVSTPLYPKNKSEASPPTHKLLKSLNDLWHLLVRQSRPPNS